MLGGTFSTHRGVGDAYEVYDSDLHSIILQERGLRGSDWIQLAHEEDKRRPAVSALVNCERIHSTRCLLNYDSCTHNVGTCQRGANCNNTRYGQALCVKAGYRNDTDAGDGYQTARRHSAVGSGGLSGWNCVLQPALATSRHWRARCSLLDRSLCRHAPRSERA
jgi:hypothetical protein